MIDKTRLKELAIGTKINLPNARETDTAIVFIKENADDMSKVVPEVVDFLKYTDGTAKSRRGEQSRIGEINRKLWKEYYGYCNGI